MAPRTSAIAHDYCSGGIKKNEMKLEQNCYQLNYCTHTYMLYKSKIKLSI